MVEMQSHFIPLYSTTIINDTVQFKVKANTEQRFSSISSSSNVDNINRKLFVGECPRNECEILDVLETDRPPDLPQYWFYPPGRLGPFQWSNKCRSVGCGLVNYANTCFLNATIQAMAYCPPFAQDCLSGKHSSQCPRNKRGQICGFCQFEFHIRKLHGGNQHDNSKGGSDRIVSFSPVFVKLMRKEIKMNQDFQRNWFGSQNCAHEWLVQFLDFLSKYDLPIEVQQDFDSGRLREADIATCYVQQLFSTCVQELKICQSCHKATANYELHTSIRVSLTRHASTLESALKNAFKSELLTGDNRPTCEACGVRRDKLSTRFIYRPPNVLAVLLQRAEFRSDPMKQTNSPNRYVSFDSSIKKNCIEMKIPLHLNLSSLMNKQCKELFCSSGNNDDYEFSASVNHSGGAGFGHYWTIAASPDGHYYKLDDELVTVIPPSSLERHLASAYLLFYTRKTPVDVVAPVVNAGESVALYSLKCSGTNAAGGSSVECRPWMFRLLLELNTKPKISEVEEKNSIRHEQTDHLEKKGCRKIKSRLKGKRLSRRLRCSIYYSRIIRRRNLKRKRPQSSSCGAGVSQAVPTTDSHEATQLPEMKAECRPPVAPEILAAPRLDKRTRIIEEPFKPDVRIEKLRSLKFQYENHQIDPWDSSDNESQNGRREHRKAFEKIQRSLAPQSRRRNRHDKDYDLGKVKKVRSENKKAYGLFNFGRKADQFVATGRNNHRV